MSASLANPELASRVDGRFAIITMTCDDLTLRQAYGDAKMICFNCGITTAVATGIAIAIER